MHRLAAVSKTRSNTEPGSYPSCRNLSCNPTKYNLAAAAAKVVVVESRIIVEIHGRGEILPRFERFNGVCPTQVLPGLEL
jgi:hypothetical protein